MQMVQVSYRLIIITSQDQEVCVHLPTICDQRCIFLSYRLSESRILVPSRHEFHTSSWSEIFISNCKMFLPLIFEDEFCGINQLASCIGSPTLLLLDPTVLIRLFQSVAIYVCISAAYHTHASLIAPMRPPFFFVVAPRTPKSRLKKVTRSSSFFPAFNASMRVR